MSAAVVALMVLLLLLVALGAVLLASQGLKREVDKVHRPRGAQTASDKD